LTLAVAVLEAGAIAFATVFVALQIRHWQGSGDFEADSTRLEVGLHVSALGAQALAGLMLSRRAGRRVLDIAWRLQGALALLGGLLLLLANPVWMDDASSHTELAFAYLVPALLAGAALAQRELARVLKPLGLYALLAGFAWLSLTVRLAFHPDATLGHAELTEAEMWTLSGAWLAYGAALMAAGIRAALEAARPALWAEVARGELAPTLAWLRENVHQHANLLTTQQVLDQAVGPRDLVADLLAHLDGRGLAAARRRA
jgi:uncharacterized membrane protein